MLAVFSTDSHLLRSRKLDTTNLYKAAAEAQWLAGEHGEVIARELAHALVHIISQQVGNHPRALAKEFKKLIAE